MSGFKSYAIFAHIVAAGSLSGAARKLGVSSSAVSQALRSLEQQSGVTLLNRSTRQLSLTEAGARCYPHCQRMVDAAEAATLSLDQSRDAPTGELRVAAPLGFAPYVSAALSGVLEEWDDLSVNLIVEDTMIDLVEQRIDIALRVGELRSSEWLAKKLCDFELLLAASPRYLNRHGVPKSPEELQGHRLIATPGGPKVLTRDNERYAIPAAARIKCSNQVAARQMCEEGAGIASLIRSDIAAALQDGALVQVLPEWHFAQIPVFMVRPPHDERPAKVQVASQAIERFFKALTQQMAPNQRSSQSAV